MADPGDVPTAKGNLGLGSVDNTADADKPISSAQQAVFDVATSDIADLTAQSNGVFTPTNQIFDKDDPDYTVGRHINYLTGATSGNVVYDCTGYSYYIKGNPAAGNRAYAWYDASKVFISGFNFGPLSITAPASAAW